MQSKRVPRSNHAMTLLGESYKCSRPLLQSISALTPIYIFFIERSIEDDRKVKMMLLVVSPAIGYTWTISTVVMCRVRHVRVLYKVC